MESNLFLCAPNLIGDIYRNNNVQSAGKFHDSYDFIDINQDGVFALGTSDLCGRLWSGSVWAFTDISAIPDAEKCLGGMDFDCGVPAGKWFNGGGNIAVGSDSGAVNILAIASLVDANKQYLSLKSVMCDHEDGITSLDVSFDNLKIVTGSRDMSINIYDVENVVAEKTYHVAHTNPVNSVSFKPGETDVLISTSSSGDTLLWDIRQSKPSSLLFNTESGFTAGTWLDDNSVILGANNGLLHIVDVRVREELENVACSGNPIHYINLERSSQFLAVCADDNEVNVYDCSKKNFRKIYQGEKHNDYVRGLCWKGPNNLYSCGFDTKVVLHEILVDGTYSPPNATMEENGGGDLPNEEK